MGYVSGKSPGYRAPTSIISNVWKCEATLTIHDSGWLIYKFKTEEEKLTVLRGGPYLVYGRPLVLRPMTKYFDFSSEEMSRVPVWVKLPSLPLCCWSPVCLSKIASGKPIQCDQPTSNLSRMSYARVLVEIDLLEALRHSVEISLSEGPTLHQKVVYENLPKYCNFCHVLGHSRLLCPKASAATNLVSPHQPQAQAAQATKGGVLSRLGPQLSHQGTPPLSQVQGQSQDQALPVASGVATISEAVHATTEGWVTVKPRSTSPPRPDPLVVPSCTGDVRVSSHHSVESLVAHPSAGEARNPSPARNNLLDANPDNIAMAGNTARAPSLDVSAKSGVRTRNQKNRDRSGRASPSPTLS